MKKMLICLLLALCLCLCLVLVSCAPTTSDPSKLPSVPGTEEPEKKGEITFSPDAGGNVNINEPNQQVSGSTVLH